MLSALNKQPTEKEGRRKSEQTSDQLEQEMTTAAEEEIER